MHRFYLAPDACRGNTLTLSGREAHHALHVLRVRRGENLVVLDGAGTEFLCAADEPARDQLPLSVVEKKTFAPLPYQLTLVQAIPKGKLIEAIVQKATELGVHRVVPIHSERTVVQFDGDSAEAKREKWELAALEAIKQCGNPWLPRIEPPQPLKDCLARREPFDLSLVAALQDDRQHPRECFRKFAADNGRLPRSVCVWVGPEGDFTPAELSAIQDAGALPISLGPLVLRSDTAAIYCLSVLNYELQASQ